MEPLLKLNSPSSPTSSLTSPSATSKTDQELETIARTVLAEVKKETQCSHDVVSRLEVTYLEQTNPTIYNATYYYKKCGERFLRYLRHQLHLEEIRAATQLATEQFKSSGSLQYPNSATSVAIAKAGTGECQEVANAATLKCNLLGLKTLLVMVSNNSKNPRTSDYHCFILIETKHTEYESVEKKYGNNFIEVLSHLEHGVLLDPFLNLVCQLKEFRTKGSDLQKYAQTYGLNYIYNTVEVKDPNPKQSRKLQEEALRVYERTQQILNDQEIRATIHELLRNKPISLKGMEKEVLGLLSDDIIAQLQRIYPNSDIAWKRNVQVEAKIWAEGSSTQITRLHDYLKNLGVILNVKLTQKKKGTENVYAGFLENPNLDQLRKIPSSTAKAPSP
jgi:hypothetical protein